MVCFLFIIVIFSKVKVTTEPYKHEMWLNIYNGRYLFLFKFAFIWAYDCSEKRGANASLLYNIYLKFGIEYI